MDENEFLELLIYGLRAGHFAAVRRPNGKLGLANPDTAPAEMLANRIDVDAAIRELTADHMHPNFVHVN